MPNYLLLGHRHPNKPPLSIKLDVENDDEAAEQAKRAVKASSLLKPVLYRVEEVKVDFEQD
ncbi:hypothetical protein ACFL6I_24265 [candidate division KSB1 bacterium]